MSQEGFNLIDATPEKCNHKHDDKNTTLHFLRGRLNMAYPRKYYAICMTCGKAFEFIESEISGRLIEITNNKERRDNDVDV